MDNHDTADRFVDRVAHSAREAVKAGLLKRLSGEYAKYSCIAAMVETDPKQAPETVKLFTETRDALREAIVFLRGGG